MAVVLCIDLRVTFLSPNSNALDEGELSFKHEILKPVKKFFSADAFLEKNILSKTSGFRKALKYVCGEREVR